MSYLTSSENKKVNTNIQKNVKLSKFQSLNSKQILSLGGCLCSVCSHTILYLIFGTLSAIDTVIFE
jgi:hypothetical protein